MVPKVWLICGQPLCPPVCARQGPALEMFGAAARLCQGTAFILCPE